MDRGERLEDMQTNKTFEVKAGKMSDVSVGSGNIAIGSRLAEMLGAQVGSTISLISPDGQTTPFGSVPRIVGYRVDYEYRGQRFSTLMQDPPGAFVPVRVSVEPVGR